MDKSGFKSKDLTIPEIEVIHGTSFSLSAISVKFNEKGDVIHQLFIKQHKIREESNDRPSDLTLFVCNVPPYCSKVTYEYEQFEPM